MNELNNMIFFLLFIKKINKKINKWRINIYKIEGFLDIILYFLNWIKNFWNKYKYELNMYIVEKYIKKIIKVLLKLKNKFSCLWLYIDYI